MYIKDIMDEKLLAQMLMKGYVRTQVHPTLPYVIYNYTETAAYERVWNPVTLQCRGLIAHASTGMIIARPFAKFFNHGQQDAPALDLEAKVHVTDKADGSLGILYPTPGLTANGYSIATRGSFTSEQAIHATEVFNRKYGKRWAPQPDYTFLFEIVYPENRIVLDYKGVDDLFMLTAVDNVTGWSIPRAGFWSRWPGPTVQSFEYNTLAEALAAPMRPNAEGLVVHDLQTDVRIKIKQADYIALHRVLTHTSARTIWSYLAVNACKHLVGTLIKRDLHWGTYLGLDPKRALEILAVGDDWFDQFIAGVPDEFYAWLKSTMRRMQQEVVGTRHELERKMHVYAAQASEDGAFNRTKFWDVMYAESPQHRGMIMSLYNEQDSVTATLWKNVYPGVELPFKTISEDVA